MVRVFLVLALLFPLCLRAATGYYDASGHGNFVDATQACKAAVSGVYGSSYGGVALTTSDVSYLADGSTPNGAWCRISGSYWRFLPWTGCPSGKEFDSSSGQCSDHKCVPGISGATSDLVNGKYCDSTGCVMETTTVVTPKGSRTVWLSSGAKCDGEAPAPSNAPSAPDSSASSPSGSGPCPGGADVCPPSKGSCPKGTFATEVGGSAVCVSTQPLSSESPKSNQTSGQAGSTGTSTKTTTTKTTNNPDGSTTTTETSSETKSGTESKPNDMAGFCKENPEAAVCGDGGSWSGSCAGFTCGGDPVQCAQAQAAWQLKCSMEVDASSKQVQDGNRAMGGGFTNGDPTKGGEVDVSSTFDTSERYAAQCPADPSFTVWGRLVHVPLSEGCKWFSILGQAAVAVCALAGARIALGG